MTGRVTLHPELDKVLKRHSVDFGSCLDLQNQNLKQDLQRDFDAYSLWLSRRGHASMSYMELHDQARKEFSAILPSAKTATLILLPYAVGVRTRSHAGPENETQKEPENLGDFLPLVARYARGKDYHKVLKRILNAVAEDWKLHFDAPFEYRAVVDSAPVLERAQARSSGLGFVGKNTMLIRPGIGSYFFIATLVTSLEPSQLGLSETTANPIDKLSCGSCRKCLDACPTGALSSEYFLDANLCLSYQTIEHRGLVDEKFIPHFGDQIYGCDICQEACPYNFSTTDFVRNASIRTDKNSPLLSLRPIDVAIMHQGDYEKWFGGTAMTRAKYDGLVRNAIYHMYTVRDARLTKVLELRRNDESEVIRAVVAQVTNLL